MTTILITGADGFIGASLVAALSKGYRVLALSRRRPQPAETGDCNVANLPYNGVGAFEVLEPVHAVVHAAGLVPSARHSVYQLVQSNVCLTQRVIESSVAAHVPLIILISTVSVYGTVTSDTVDETSPIHAPNAYGMTKRVSEMLLADQKDSIGSVALRLPAVIGRGARWGLLARLRTDLSKDRPVTLYNPRNLFNLVGIRDLARAVDACVRVRAKGHEIFNLACTSPLTLEGIVQFMKARLGSRSSVSYDTTSEAGFRISTRRIYSALGVRAGMAASALTSYLDDNA